MANTVRKLIGGLARLNGRSYATEEDLQEIWHLLQGKLEVIHWVTGKTDRLRPLGQRDEVVRAAQQDSDQRFLTLLRAYGGTQAAVEEMAQGLNLSVRTVQRELLDRGYRADRGLYTLPTEAEYLDEQDALQRAGEEILPAAPSDEDDVPPPVVAAVAKKVEVRDLVEPLPRELLPLAIALNIACKDVEALTELKDMVQHLLVKPQPPYPELLLGSANQFLTVLETFQDLYGRAAMQHWLAEPDREIRGQRVLSLLAHGGYPDLAESASVWLFCQREFPPGVQGIIEALAARLAAFRDEEHKQRELAERRQRVPVAVMLSELRC